MCAWHDPQLAAERAGWRQKGGQSRSNRARAKKALPAEALTLQEVQALLGLTFKGVISGRIEPGVANAAANIARALVATREAAEFDARLAALEAGDVASEPPA